MHPPHQKDIFHHFEKRYQSEKKHSPLTDCYLLIHHPPSHTLTRGNSDGLNIFFDQSCLFQKHKYILWRISIIIYVESFLQAIWFGFDLTHFMRTCFVLVTVIKVFPGQGFGHLKDDCLFLEIS